MKMKCESVTAIILAGGLSSRMGACKAELMWNGSTLIEHQVDKMRELGIEDIIISGYPKPVEGTRFVPDKYPLKGPLGGIHAGLAAAQNSHCLVTGIDTPLVPTKTLSELIQTHIACAGDITVLTHGNMLEPLIGVYEHCLSGIVEEILQGDNTAVRQLLHRVGYNKFVYAGEEKLLCDCNTPEEFASALSFS